MTANERAHALTHLYISTRWFNMAPEDARPAITTYYIGYIEARGYCLANIYAASDAAHVYMLGWLEGTRQAKHEPAS